jgi:hypothetical protein
MITETYFLTFRRELAATLAARGRVDCGHGDANRCYRAGLSIGDSATLLASFLDYTKPTERYWIRPLSEFLDGRFETIDEDVPVTGPITAAAKGSQP